METVTSTIAKLNEDGARLRNGLRPRVGDKQILLDTRPGNLSETPRSRRSNRQPQSPAAR